MPSKRQILARLVPSSLRGRLPRRRFAGSGTYWTERYRRGENSGVGSYGELAKYKAGFLNSFVKDHNVGSVIELGCGDGHQLSLASYHRYVGLDVAAGAIELCVSRFAEDRSKSFFLFDPRSFHDGAGVLTSQLSLSLDVIYHLVEDETFAQYLQLLFGLASEFVIIYSSNRQTEDPGAHVRHRRFTPWIDEHFPDWTLDASYANPLAGGPGAVADFYVYRRRTRPTGDTST